MRILVIAENIGKTAPGIVFERIIRGLSGYHAIDLLTSAYEPSSDDLGLAGLYIVPKPSWFSRFNKVFIKYLSVNPLLFKWVADASRHLKLARKTEYDVILSLLSFQHYTGLIAGAYLSKKYKTRYAVYSVDAIPAPFGWMPEDRHYHGLRKMMRKYLSGTDALFSANEKMLQYQLSTFTPKNNLVSEVVYNPGFDEPVDFAPAETKDYCFVYTGGIYGLRTPRHLLKGFELLLDKAPNARLIFVGTQVNPEMLASLNSNTIGRIEFVPFTRELDPYYKMATALLDLDADIDNDVFLSSKVINYLMYNRVIICETGKNSPSRALFKGIDSIIQCDHNAAQLCDAMQKAIAIKETVSYEDRAAVRQLFKPSSIARKMSAAFNQMSI